MPHYKDSKNKLYFLDDAASAADFLPTDCLEISDEEEAAIRRKNQPEISPEQRLISEILTVEGQITPRMLRDAALGRDSARLFEKEAVLDKLRADLAALKIKNTVKL